jgi:hypothetical protein
MMSFLVVALMVCSFSGSALKAGGLPGSGKSTPPDASGQLPITTAGDLTLVENSYSLDSIEFPGARATFVRGINNHAEMVGSYRIIGTRRLLVISDGELVTFPPTHTMGANWAEGFGLNDRGDIVGEISFDNGFTVHGFLLGEGDPEPTPLDFPGACATHARGINESGTIVGFWEECDSEGTIALHGFTWKKGAFSGVDYQGAIDTYLVGINASGDIVGGWQSESDARSFILSRGQFNDFDLPLPDATEGPLAINASGDVAGSFSSSDGTYGFLLDGKTLNIIEYPGAPSTVVYGVNSAGQVVGVHRVGSANQGFFGQPSNKQKP